MSFADLLNECEQVYQNTAITAEQVKMVEEKTREQSSSKLWFQQRVGCVTASKLRNVLHTKIFNPSKSLLTSICYPELTRFHSKTCMYGCKHEDDARKAYSEVMSSQHRSFSVTKSGLVLDMSRHVPATSVDSTELVNTNSNGADPHYSDDNDPSQNTNFGDTGTIDSGVELWCYCKQDKNLDYLIGCDNNCCPIQWFHLSCKHDNGRSS